MTDLLALTAELVDIPSVSHHEAALADKVEADLRGAGHLEVLRFDDTVVARTRLADGDTRVVLAGHLDTVPPFDDAPARLEGDRVWGLGAVDMKGGIAVLLDLAATVTTPAVDVTYVLYVCEEVTRRENALGHLALARPDLLHGDAAVLCEPTAGVVEAGCQGTMRVVLTLGGRRAHTSRPWTGVNAVHRLAPVLAVLERYEPRRVVLDGCQYTEQLQAVGIEGGVAGNVVPDRATITINYPVRLTPMRPRPKQRCAPCWTPFSISRRATASPSWTPRRGLHPGWTTRSWRAWSPRTDAPPRSKLGWTDVATFAEIGVPATNFGPGDPLLAHTPDELVSRPELEHVRDVLAQVLLTGGD